MTSELEREVEEFFDIESDLQERAEMGVATPAMADVDSGIVIAADRRSPPAVPDDYPVRITGERVLSLELEVDHDTKTTVFLDWPDEGNDFGQIETLLDVTDVSVDSFADVYGKSVPLDVSGDYVVVEGVEMSHSTGTNDEYDQEEDADQEDDTSSSPLLGVLLVLSGPWSWAAYEHLVGNGLTVLGWAGWIVVAVLLAAFAEVDRNWVAETTGRRLSPGWVLGFMLCAPIALPLYSLWRYYVLRN